MSFLEDSRGIYRPIRVLFDTPIYNRALQLCWHESSYKSQIALVVGLLKLQQKNEIPSQVTAEDMTSLVFERSASTLRERFWEFEVEGLDEEDAKPLLSLVWSVNLCNKMRDVAYEAKMLLNSQEALPPFFQHPKLLSVAEGYAEILCDRQKEASRARLLPPRQVVLEVVPRALQDFWVLPPRPLLNMPSQQLSKMSVGVTKAVLDRVFSDLTDLRHQVIFSRSIRDKMIRSILAKIRQACPHEVLVDRIKTFSSVLLNEIVEVAVGQICEIFKSLTPEDPARLTSIADPSTSSQVQDHFNVALSEEQQMLILETSTGEESPLEAPQTLPAEAAPNERIQDTEVLNEQGNQEPETELESAAAFPPPPHPVLSISFAQTGEDVSEMHSFASLTESVTKTSFQESFATDMTEIKQQTLSQKEIYSAASPPGAPLPSAESQSMAKKDVYEKMVEKKTLNINAHINMVFSAMQDGVFKTNFADFPQHPSLSVEKNKEVIYESQKLSADQIQLGLLLLNLC